MSRTARRVWWDQDADGVLYQLSVCVNSTHPDNGYMVTTTDTTLSFSALPTLSPYTLYRLYLRKQCDFSTSHTNMVWGDWSSPAVIYRRSGLGIDEVDCQRPEVRVYAEQGRIVVEGAEGMEVMVYDAKGTPVGNRDLPAGVYMVKVGDQPVRRVAVVR